MKYLVMKNDPQILMVLEAFHPFRSKANDHFIYPQ